MPDRLRSAHLLEDLLIGVERHINFAVDRLARRYYVGGKLGRDLAEIPGLLRGLDSSPRNRFWRELDRGDAGLGGGGPDRLQVGRTEPPHHCRELAPTLCRRRNDMDRSP